MFRHLMGLMLLIRTLFLALVMLLPAWAQEAPPSVAAGDSSAGSSSEPGANAGSDAAIQDLIGILEDDQARARLIETLKQSAGTEGATVPTEAPAEGAAPADASSDVTIAPQLAEYTQGVAEGAATNIRALGVALDNMLDVLTGQTPVDWAKLGDFAINIGLVVAGLFGTYIALRLLSEAIARRMVAKSDADGLSWPRKVRGLLPLFLMDLASVGIALVVGGLLALYTGTTPDGQMTPNEALLLGAFLIVETSQLMFRMLLVPRNPALRLLPITDYNAAYWSFWMERLISLVGYTFLFVAPMLVQVFSPAAGIAAQVLIMGTALTVVIVIILQNRDEVRAWLNDAAVRSKGDGLARFLGILGAQWHVLAIVYLLVLFVVWFANPYGTLPFMLGATVQSLIAVGVGSLVLWFIGRFVTAGLSLPPDVKERLPSLETRLKSFVPGVMMAIRWFVMAGVVIAVGQAWGLLDFVGWLSTDEGISVSGSIVSAALIILITIVLYVVVASWVEYRLKSREGKAPTAREKTLLNLFKNAFTIVLAGFGLMLALAQIGVNIAPLLAGAGVVGLAIGFGAQKLVQDIITGIFIQFENIMNEGDVVEVAGKSGVVEKLTIRSVTIRDMSGTVHLIPFSSADQVSNMMRGFSFYVSEVEIDYDSDIEAAKQAMRDAFAKVMEKQEFSDVILDDLDLQGLTAITPTSVTLRSRIKTLAGKQWGPGRFYSELLMHLFAERGIDTPTSKVRYVPGRGEAKGPEPLPPPSPPPPPAGA